MSTPFVSGRSYNLYLDDACDAIRDQAPPDGIVFDADLGGYLIFVEPEDVEVSPYGVGDIRQARRWFVRDSHIVAVCEEPLKAATPLLNNPPPEAEASA